MGAFTIKEIYKGSLIPNIICPSISQMHIFQWYYWLFPPHGNKEPGKEFAVITVANYTLSAELHPEF